MYKKLILVALALTLAFALPVQAMPTGNDVTSLLTGLTASVTQNGAAVLPGGTLTNEPLEVFISFGVPVLGDFPAPGPGEYVQQGDYAEFELSQRLNLQSGTNFVLQDGGIIIGHLSFSTIPGNGISGDPGEFDKVIARVDFDGDSVVYDGTYSEVSIFFLAEMEFDAGSTSGGSGDYDVYILGEEYTVQVPPEDIVYDIQKSGEINFEEKSVTWTATVSASQEGAAIDLAGYVFEDDLTNAGPFIPGTLQVNGFPQLPVVSPNAISYALPAPSMSPVTFTYQTEIPDSKYLTEGEQTVGNRAALNDPTDLEVAFDDATLTFTPGWIVKTGQSSELGGAYDPTNRTITWVILVNSRDLDLNDVVVTDSIPAGLSYLSSSVEYWNGTAWGPAAPITPVGNTYALGDLTYRARLTLVASVPDEAYTAGITTYTNSGSVNWEGSGIGGSGVGSGGVGVGVGFNPIYKSGSADTQTRTISWSVMVDVRQQDVLDSLKVYDLLIWGETLPGGASASAPVSLSSLSPRFNLQYLAGSFSGTGLPPVVVYPVMNGGTRIGDLLEISGLSTGENAFGFTTLVRNPQIFAGNQTTTVPNTASLFNGTTFLNQATAEVEYDGRVVKKTMLDRAAVPAPQAGANNIAANLEDGFDYVDKSVIFRLSVNINDMNLPEAINAVGVLPGDVRIQDTLPAGWEYVDFSPGVKYLILQGTGVLPSGDVQADTGAIVNPAGTKSVSGGSASFTFTNLNQQYVILLKARPTDAEQIALFNANKVTTVANTMTMVIDDWGGFSVSSTQDVNVVSRILGKGAEKLSAGEIRWMLRYRPYGIDNIIAPYSAAYIIDTIPSGAELRTNAAGILLIPGNIALNKLEPNEDGTYSLGDAVPIVLGAGGNLIYNNATRELRFNIPDNQQAYQLTYITDITGIVGATLTNDASLFGKADVPANASWSIVISSADAGASLTKGGRFQFTKVGGLGNPLPGAEYTLFALDGVTTIRTATSSANGVVSMRVIPEGSYILRETGVPAGYLTDPDHAVVVTKNPGGTYTVTIDGVDPASSILYIRNITTVKADVSATKTWLGGFEADRTPPVTLTLFADGVPVNNAIIPPAITETPAGSGVYTYTWTELPVNDLVSGDPIVYTADELTTPTGYAKTSNTLAREVTNSYIVTAQKTWENGRFVEPKPDLWFKLFRQVGTGPLEEVPGALVQQLPAPTYPSGFTAVVPVVWLGLDAEDALGNAYTFVVQEGTWDGVTFTQSEPLNFPISSASGTQITNSYVSPKTDVPASKTWVGYQDVRPTVWFRLQRRTTAATTYVFFDSVVKELPDGTTSVSFDDLDVTDIQGRPYEYRVREVDASGALTTPANYTKEESGLTVTNRYRVSAAKVWENGRFYQPKPDLWFKLYRQSGLDPVTEVPGAAVLKLPEPTYPAGVFTSTVTVQWTGLDADNPLTDDPYVYSVVEGSWDGTTFTPGRPLNFPNGAVTELQITNSYLIPTDAQVTAAKTWQFGTTARPTIWFRLYRQTTAMAAREEVPGAPIRQLNPGDASVSWTGLERTDIQARPYSFSVVEGSYDGSVFTPGAPANYQVTYGPAAASPASLTVNNQYIAAGQITLAASKQLTGRALKANEFRFRLTDVTGGGSTVLQNNVGNLADGSIPFAPITYNETAIGKTYRYEITEIAGTETGMAYDAGLTGLKIYYNVQVTDAGNGQASAAIVAPLPADTQFNNTYTATGQTTFSVTKTLEGRDLKNEEFEFLLRNVTNTPTVIGIETKKNDAAGLVQFSAINYTQLDIGKTFYYDILEVVPASPETGMSYDTSPRLFKVEVADAGNGVLTVTQTPLSGGSVFTNTYRATGSITLEATKALTGRELAEDAFRFRLTQVSPGPLTVLQDLVGNEADGSIPFAPILYDEEDIGETFRYEITEIPGLEGGMAYDTTLKIAYTVSVTDAGNGVLNAAITETDPADDTEFNNAYTAAGETSFSVSKALSGRALKDEEFSFELYDISGSAPVFMETVKNDNSGLVQFGAILYDQLDIGKTFYYRVNETVPASPETGMTYSTLTAVFKVEVTDAGGGVLTVTTSPLTGTVFTNTYRATGSILLEASKELTGRDLLAGAFLFRLTDVTTPGAPLILQDNVMNLADGSIPFAPIVYNQDAIAKTFSYEIIEIAGSEGGMAYDTGLTIAYNVLVTDATNGALSVTLEAPLPTDTVFDNAYTATGQTSFFVNKALDGRVLGNEEFTFLLRDVSDRDNIVDIETQKNDAAGLVQFSPITYDQEDAGKTFYYEVTEVVPGSPETGMTFDLLPKLFKVEVADAGGGDLTVTTTPPADTIFNNTYRATGSIVLDPSKELTGRVLKANEFSFELWQLDALDGERVGSIIDTASNALDGGITFAPINYTQADDGKTYYYEITEVPGSEGGMDYDAGATGLRVIYAVQVEDAGNSVMTVTIVAPFPADTEFNNAYTAEGSIVLAVSKSTDLNAGSRVVGANEFTFELYEVIGTGEVLRQTKTNALDGSVTFDEIDYNESAINQTFTYIVREVTSLEAGMFSDPSDINITVAVTDLGNGLLLATPDYPDDTEFNNRYSASGETSFSVTKALDGRDPADGEFTFQLRKVTGPTTTENIEQKTNDGTGLVQFSPIAYSATDIGQTYNYEVVEVVPGSPEGGMTYSSLVARFQVDVADAGEGVLTATQTALTATAFTNVYRASGSIVLEASKALSGRPLKANEFNYELWQLDGPAGTRFPPMVGTASNALDGSITFAPILYTQADDGETYYYEITEVPGSELSMDYDDLKVIVSVYVEDLGGGLMLATPTYPTDVVFDNSYTAEGSIVLAVSKSLNLSAGSRVVQADEFTFNLYEVVGGVEVLRQTKTNAADGTVTFDEIFYNESAINKTFTYIVREAPALEAGIILDTNDITITVAVTDLGDGELLASPAYPSDSQFNNRYEASGEAVMQVQKSLSLDAGGRFVKDGEFTFNLYAGTDTSGLPLQTVTNAADGSVTFLPITYAAPDIGKTFLYTILEVPGTETGMTYDDLEVLVSVRVEDGREGVLTIIGPTYFPKDHEFINIYRATGSLVLSATKELTGRRLEAGDYTFELWQLDGPDGNRIGGMIESVTNALDGSVTFSAINYTQDDIYETYYYEITEVPGTETGMDYDDLRVTLSVYVDDLGDSVLDPIATYSVPPVFENTYTATGDLYLEVTKNLSLQAGGRLVQDQEFTFNLYKGSDITGVPIAEAKNDADGKVTFGPFPFDQTSLYETLSYTIVEYPGTENGMTYDLMTVFVTAYVKDLKNGVLGFDITYPADTEFDNTYEASGQVDLAVSKSLDLKAGKRVVQEGEFTFFLYEGADTTGTLLQTKTNAADGSVKFDTIFYDQSDIGETYDYTVVEERGSVDGMEYDPMVVHITVQVEDGREGVLTLTVTEPGDTEFNNRYRRPDPGYPTVRVPIALRKTLSGRPLKDKEFQFVLKDAAGNILDRASNDKSGNVVFKSRSFSHTGLFLYTIEEVKGDDGSIRYDATRYTMKVRVSATADDKLTYSVNFLKNDVPFGGEIVFANGYRMPGTGDNQPRLIGILLASALLTMLIALPMKKSKSRLSS